MIRHRDNRGHARLIASLVTAAGGRFHRRAKHGVLYRLPGGGMILVPRGQRTDPRARLNALADLRRRSNRATR